MPDLINWKILASIYLSVFPLFLPQRNANQLQPPLSGSEVRVYLCSTGSHSNLTHTRPRRELHFLPAEGGFIHEVLVVESDT